MLDLVDLLDRRLTLPGLFTAALFLAAAALARMHPPRARTRAAAWSAILLVLLAVEELGWVHERLEAFLGVPHAVAYAGAAALGVAAAGVVIGELDPNERGRRLLVGGGLVWLVSQGLAAAASAPFQMVGEVLEMGAAALFALALLVAVRAGWRGRGEDGRVREAALAIVERAEARRLALAAGVWIVALAALGWLVNVEKVPLYLFDSNKEQTVPAFFSAAVLLAAATLAYLLGWLRAERRRESRWLWFMGIVFVAMAIDEAVALHERIGYYLDFNAAGQIPLFPLILAAGVAWLMTLRALGPDRAPRSLFIGGAAIWVLSQAIDLLAAVGIFLDHLLVLEDALEVAGSTLFALALLLAVQRQLAAEPADLQAGRAQAGVGG